MPRQLSPRGLAPKMPSLCDCFGQAKTRGDAYKADGPASDGLPSQISIPASAASAAAEGNNNHKEAVGEQGATREAARQQRAETTDEPECDTTARGRADVQDAAPNKKDKHGGGHERCAEVGGAADGGVPTVVVIKAGDEKEGGQDEELDTEQVHPVVEESTREQPGAGAAAAEVVEAGDIDGGEDAEGNSAVLQDLGQQVIKECGAIALEGAETAEGLAEFVGSLASGGAEGAVKALENFGPVGPLFKCLGMFIHFVGQVKAARGEGQRLRLWGQIHSPVLSTEFIALSHVLICICWGRTLIGLTCDDCVYCAAETLIPIIRQSVPVPFPADIEKSKQEELTQCTQQAVEAIEALQESIGEVAKSKESWKRFFTAGKFIERMAEVKERPCVWLCV